MRQQLLFFLKEVKKRMTGLAADMVALIDMIARNYQKLEKLNPGHELLRFIQRVTQVSVKWTDREELSDEFFKRFPNDNENPEGKPSKVYSFIRYNYALSKAIDAEEKKE